MRLLSISLLLVLNILNLLANDWEYAKEKDGIKVYTRAVDGSEIKQFRAETVMPFSRLELMKAVQDVENYPAWVDKCSSSKLISATDSNKIYHVEISMPFPIDDRDLVSNMKWEVSNNEVKLNIAHINGVIEPQEGVVRMPNTGGSWTFESVENNWSKVTYQYQGDPGGSIPSWVINMFIVDGPIATLQNLKAYLSKQNSLLLP